MSHYNDCGRRIEPSDPLVDSFPTAGEKEFNFKSKQILNNNTLHKTIEGNKFSYRNMNAKQQTQRKVRQQQQRSKQTKKKNATQNQVAPPKPPRRASNYAKHPFPVAARGKNFGRYDNIVRQLISPATCDDHIYPTPNPGGVVPVVPRRYRRVVDVVPTSTKFSVLMSPNLFLPGMITRDELTTVPSAGTGPFTISCPREKSTVAAIFKMDATAMVKTANQEVGPIFKLTKQPLAGPNYYHIPISACDVTNQMHMIFHNTSKNEIQKVRFGWGLAGAYTFFGAEQSVLTGESVKFSYLGKIDDIVIKADVLASLIGDGKSSFQFDVTMSNAQFEAEAGVHFAPAFSRQIGELDIANGRVLGMSMKITNTSHALNKGGNISIGRVPSYSDFFTGQSEMMSTLPANRVYQNCLAEGGNVFWFPEQNDEWVFDSIEKKRQSYSDANVLLAHCDGYTVGASFRVTFGWTVEFYTTSQNFPKVPTPPWNNEFEIITSLISHMDAAGCNPESSNIFHRYLQSGRDYLKHAVEHLDMNKETYSALLSFLTKALV